MQQSTICQFQSDKQLIRTLLNNFGNLLVFVFHAQWNQKSQTFKQNFINALPFFGQLANVKYYSIAAQSCPQTLVKFGVEFTPTVIFTQTDKKVLKRIEGLDIGLVFDALSDQSQTHRQLFQKQRKTWHPKISSILSSCPVIIFIKGTPLQPKCGFTQTLLSLLKQHAVQYTYYDIIADESMKYWLRHYSGWPTYPQVYVKGMIVGGVDVVKEQLQNGQFLEKVPASSRHMPIDAKYNLLLKQHPNLIITQHFTFQNKQLQQLVHTITSNSKDNPPVILHAGLDSRLIDHLKFNGVTLPVWLVNGVVQTK